MKRFLIAAIILALLVGAGYLIQKNPPSARRGGPPAGPQTLVDVISVAPQDYQITVNSYGTVQPRTQSMLVAQVSGQIVTVNPDFRAGGFFNQGDVLITIDPRDYEADVKIAEASLMDALQAEAQEVARAEQAKIDWQRLGQPGDAPSDLVLRKPQLEAARARASSARAALTKARLDLERTKVIAPFSGRILSQRVDLGQVVNTGTQLAELYATDYVEIRLPIRNVDLAFVELPEGQATEPPMAKVKSKLGGEIEWQGRVIRTEGAIDQNARQLHVVAQIDNPFGTDNPVERPLKIGEYITAEIAGRTVKDALVIPSETIYQNKYVYIVQDNLLQRRDVEIAWQNGRDALVIAGVVPNDKLVTTPLGQVTSGTPVRLVGEDRPQRRRDGSGNRQRPERRQASNSAGVAQ